MSDFKYKGYGGKIAWINLSTKQVENKLLTNEFAKTFIGGTGFATKILTETLNPKIDAFSPNNIITFMIGPLTGTIAPMTGRHFIASKSPLTNAWGQSDAGGFWGAEMKFAGFDGVVLTGASETPIYLFVANDKIDVLDAKSIWGLDTYETENELKQVHGKKTKVLSIGQAGENLVKIASIINDNGRAAGRRGLGAIMGSKKVKAIAIVGDEIPEVFDLDELKALRKELTDLLLSSSGGKMLQKYGTGGGMDFLLEIGDLPLKNWLGAPWDAEKALRLGSQKFFEKGYFVKHMACYSCPIGCTKAVQIKEGPYQTPEPGKAPEYETLAALGSLSDIDNLEAIIKANDLANRYGIDTIATGEMIAFLRELHEKGVKIDTQLNLEWGDGNSVIELVEAIAFKKDVGKIMADGPKALINKFGQEIAEVGEVKNDGIPMHDPRTYLGMGLKYAVTVYGPDHSRADAGFLFSGNEDLSISKVDNPTPRDVAYAIVQTENFVEVMETLVMCLFAYESWAARMPPRYVPRLIKATTGIEITLKELLSLGGKLVDMKKTFNRKAGLTRKDDYLPKRFKNVPRVHKGKEYTIEIDDYIKEYYKLRMWDEE